MVYRLIPKRLKQFVDGWCQPMSLKCKASLGLPIIIEGFIKKYAQVAKSLYKLISGRECSQETEVQLNGI